MKKRKILIVLALLLGGWASAQNISPEDYDDGLLNENGITSGFGNGNFNSSGLISSNPDLTGGGTDFSSSGLISSNPDIFGGGTDFNSSGLFGVNFGGGFESDDYGDGQLPLGSGIALLAALACGYAGIKRNNKHSNDI